jgi:hypothetical protein
MVFSEIMDEWAPVTVTIDDSLVFHVGEGFGWIAGNVLEVISPALSPGTHTLTVSGALDFSGNPISPDPAATSFTQSRASPRRKLFRQFSTVNGPS